MPTDYTKRLLLPASPVEEDGVMEFKTSTGMVVAHGYTSVVIGQRGPYVEFSEEQIVRHSLVIPDNQKWRSLTRYNYVFYDEYRSADAANVKFYLQRKPVDYAAYREGFWYASPFQLQTEKYPVLVKPAEKKVNKSVKPEPWMEPDMFDGQT